MKKKFLLAVFIILVMPGLYSQRFRVNFTFTAVDNGVHVKLDSMKIIRSGNRPDTMAYWPDTSFSYGIIAGHEVLLVGYATFSQQGISEIEPEGEQFRLFQNYPDPASGQSMISLVIPEKGTVQLLVTDIMGRRELATEMQLQEGHHSFRFSPGNRHLFLISVTYKGITRSIKIIDVISEHGSDCRLDYAGYQENRTQVNFKSEKRGIVKRSGIVAYPESDGFYTFQFATNIPCPGTPEVDYGGQVYNTIQVFSQCWLKENLNVGTRIDIAMQQSNDGIIEKYCYNNEPDSCTKYGGYYQWNEMMQYGYPEQFRQGICPPGWHLPTDNEWKVLEGAVDSQYGIGDDIWDEFLDRGFDAGKNMKTTSGWIDNGNGTDLFGFSALPAGYNTGQIGIDGVWWTSTIWQDPIYPLDRLIRSGRLDIRRASSTNTFGFNVRCLRND